MSHSLKASTVTVTKTSGSTIIAPVYSPDDRIVITGDSLESGDWTVLKGLTDKYHLELQTPNKELPVNALSNNKYILSVTAPDIILIGSRAFEKCTELFSVSLPSAVTIGSSAFYTCSQLSSVSFPLVTSIGGYAFAYCSRLSSISFPSVTSIEQYAFSDCVELLSVSLPAVTTMGHGVFAYCSRLSSVSFPMAVTMENFVFTSCFQLSSVSLPVVTLIGSYAFQFCAELSSVSFPLAVTIGNRAFYDCGQLSSVSFPSVTSIEEYAFYNCTDLQSAVLSAVPPTIGPNAFSGVSALLLIVPDSTAYTSVLSGYPPGSEAFNKRVTTETAITDPGMPVTLTPDRLPTLDGGVYRWEKDGLPIPGANGSTYQTDEEGVYTLRYIRGGEWAELLSVHLAHDAFDLSGTYRRYAGCDYVLDLSFTPSAASRTVEVWCEGPGAGSVYDRVSGKSLIDPISYRLAADDSVFTIGYQIAEGVEDGSKARFVYRLPGGAEETTLEYTLYARPAIELLRYYPVTAQFEGMLEISIAKGPYYIERSADGGQSWQLARDTVTGEVIPFTKSQLAELEPGSLLLFRVPGGCDYDTLRIGEAGGETPPILRPVTMPSVSDVVVSVLPGQYSVVSGDDFMFTVAPTGSNAGKQPHITTSRTSVPDSEGVLIEDRGDGTFRVTILRIQEPVSVMIDFATGSEWIETTAVWSENNRLYIRTPEASEAFIHTITGSLVQRVRLESGETEVIALPGGIYAVTLGGKAYKVIVR